MGQYFKIINLTKQQYLASYDFNSGAKLLESCYQTEDYQTAIEYMLDGEWANDKVIFCGDYAWDFPTYAKVFEKMGIKSDPWKLCQKYENAAYLVPMVDGKVNFTPKRYIVNATTCEYVDRKTSPIAWTYKDDNGNPVFVRYDEQTLLLAVGNGLGGGDYRGQNAGLVGAWAGDDVYTTDTIPEGFFELEHPFDEYGIFNTATDEQIDAYFENHTALRERLYDPTISSDARFDAYVKLAGKLCA